MVHQHGKDYIKMIDINKLPDGWDNITLEQFNKALNVIVHEEDDNEEFVIEYLIKVASVILDVPVSELREDIVNVFQIVNRLTFFLNTPDYDKDFKSNYVWQSEVKLSYDDYVSLVQIMKRMETGLILNELEPIIKIMLVDKDIDVTQMNMMEVYQGFFLHKKQLLKYLHHSQMQTIKQVIKQKFRQLFKMKERK